jgi:hypothetical protein
MHPGGPEKVRLKLPKQAEHQVEILGKGPEAAARAVELFQRLGLV